MEQRPIRTPVLGGSLKLPPAHALGVAPGTVSSIEEKWNTIAKVNAQLKRWGMPENTEPDVKWQPVSTELLLTASINEYTNMYASQLRWFNYVNRLLADAKATLLGAENQLKELQATARKHIRDLHPKEKGKKSGPTAQEISDMVENDPDTLDLRLQVQKLQQTKIKLEAWMEECDESKKVVSRQIELRREEAQGGRRDGNLTGGSANPHGQWQSGQPRRFGGG